MLLPFKFLSQYKKCQPHGINDSAIFQVGNTNRMCSVSSSSQAVNNHQLPSYMTGFLYPLGNKKGVYSFVRCNRYDELTVERLLKLLSSV